MSARASAGRASLIGKSGSAGGLTGSYDNPRQALRRTRASDESHAKMRPVGPVAQLVRAGDSSRMVPSHRKVRSGRDEFRETLTARLQARLMATLSQAGGTPPEGAETT